MKKILIVNFTFPPYPGIGARRWAKFAKYLFRAGHDIRIITARKILAEQSPWLKDIQEFEDRIEYIKPPYPQILGTIPITFFQKVRYKVALEFVRMRYGSGNYFDPSTGFGKRIKASIQNHIHSGYDNLLVSCGPFHMAHELLELKRENPGLNFVVDFRDPWANNRTSFGFLTISKKRLYREMEMEKEVIAASDHVISVSPEMTEYFRAFGSKATEKFYTMENGFDVEDFEAMDPKETSKKDVLRFVFTGTLYEKTRHIFSEFTKALRKISVNDPQTFSLLRFDFYGKVPAWFQTEMADLQSTIYFHGEVVLEEVYRQIALSNAGTLFLTDDLTYTRSTKFYEYLAMRKPIVVFSKGGATGEFAEDNGVGFAVNMDSMEEDLIKVLERMKSKGSTVGLSMDLSQWDIAKAVDRLSPIWN